MNKALTFHAVRYAESLNWFRDNGYNPTGGEVARAIESEVHRLEHEARMMQAKSEMLLQISRTL